MNKTQRRMLSAMLILADDSMHVEAKLTTLSKAAGYKATGGVQTYALEILERDNKILKVGDNKWLITL